MLSWARQKLMGTDSEIKIESVATTKSINAQKISLQEMMVDVSSPKIPENRFDLILISRDTEFKFDGTTIPELNKLTEKNNYIPILIKKNNQIFLYGNTNGVDWKITELDPAKIQTKFPDVGADQLILKKEETPISVYEEIYKKSAHTNVNNFSFLNNIAIIFRRLYKTFKQELENILAPEACLAVFDPSIEIDNKDNDSIFIYRNILQILKELTPFILIADKLSTLSLQILKKEGKWPKAWQAYQNSDQLNDLLNDLTKKYVELIELVKRSGIDAYIEKQLPTPKKFQRIISYIIPDKIIENNINENSIIKAVKVIRGRYKIGLIKIDSNTTPDLKYLENLYTKDYKIPLLIQHNGAIYIYGNTSEGSWKLTQLNISESISRSIQFPDINGTINITDTLPIEIYNTINRYKAHVATQDKHINKNKWNDHVIEKIILQIDGWANNLVLLLHELTKNKKFDEIIQDAIWDTVSNLKGLIKGIKRFNLTNKTPIDKIKFIFEKRNEIIRLINDMPQALISVQGATREHLLASLAQVNTIFKELFLRADFLEYQYYFKEGFLTNFSVINDYSLNTSVLQFNDWIEQLGYKFKDEDKYPYSQALLKQREEFKSNPISTSKISRLLLEKRINNAQLEICKQNEMRLEVKRNEEKTYLHDRNEILTALFDKEINERENECIGSGIHVFTKTITVALLKNLKSRLIDDNLDFESALNSPTDSPELIKHRYLLWEGSTGRFMREIRQIVISPIPRIEQGIKTPNNRLELIDVAIDDLKNIRKHKFFYQNETKSQLSELRLKALFYLKSLLSREGYRLTYALEIMNANDPELSQILNTNEKELLKKIRTNDDRTPDHIIGKLTIDNLQTKNNVLPLSISDHHSEFTHDFIAARNATPQTLPANNTISNNIEKISCAIKQLRTEASAWHYQLFKFIDDTKTKKIKLLEYLESSLSSDKTLSLKNALEKMATNSYCRPKMYLLYEGRTGALMKQLEHQDVPREELLNKLNLELIRLKNKREEPLFFFECIRKKSLILHIDALEKFKHLYAEKKSIKDCLDKLAPKEREILISSSRELLEELGWEKNSLLQKLR